MTHTELHKNFTNRNIKQSEFIEWANRFGVKIHKSDVSMHVNGSRKISKGYQLAYKLFFQEIDLMRNSH